MAAGIGRIVTFAWLLILPSTAWAWDEAVDGDLSTNAAAPTPLAFVIGNNVVAGSVTSSAPADTRDYITFTIPPGQQLTALRLMSYVDFPSGGPGNRGFHALNVGATSSVPGTGGSFLGGDHLDTLPGGTDLLPELGDADTTGTGFAGPLGPGTYSYVVQQTGSEKSGYNLQFVVSAVVAVPASTPWSALLMAALMGLMGFVALLERRRVGG